MTYVFTHDVHTLDLKLQLVVDSRRWQTWIRMGSKRHLSTQVCHSPLSFDVKRVLQHCQSFVLHMWHEKRRCLTRQKNGKLKLP